jgi:two-component system, NtrC family, response regulator AtoC
MMDKNADLTIFIVEDAEFYNAVLTTYLKTKGLNHTYSFTTARECLKKLEEIRPDIVVMDYELPGMNGLEAMNAIKAKHPKCEVIFLTGQTEIKIALQALKEGAYDYILKDTHARENLLFRIEKIAKFVKVSREKQMYRLSSWIISLVLLITLLILYIIPKFL